MPSTPSASSLSDFLALSRSVSRFIIAPTEERSERDDHVREESRRECRSYLAAEQAGWPSDSILNLRKILETAVYLDTACFEDWILLHELHEAIGDAPRCHPLSNRGAWKGALDSAVTSLNHSSFRHAMIRNSREETVARALKFLSRKGYAYKIDGLGPRLKTPAYRDVCHRIEKKISSIGGLLAANSLLNLMKRTGRVEYGSLLHARLPNTSPNNVPRPGMPWHYVYNLSLKHLSEQGRLVDPAPTMLLAEDLSRNFAASINVEPHSSYENMNISASGLTALLHETIIYDELFAFPQWQPLIGKYLVVDWLNSLEEAGC